MNVHTANNYLVMLMSGLITLCVAAYTTPSWAEDSSVTVRTLHGFALQDEPRYGPLATHPNYTNPNAPKGGTLRSWGQGTSYDNFNIFIVRGQPAYHLSNASPSHLIYDTLMSEALDETASQYGLLAESVTIPSDYAWVEYQLREEARWHDGQPIRAEDVVFSFKALNSPLTQPRIRGQIENVASVVAIGPHRVRFIMREKNNRRSVYEAGLMPVLAKHYWQDKDFNLPLVTPPLMSGPYKYGKYEIGRTLELDRVKDYWGKDLFLNRGRFNFDKIIVDYTTRDRTIAFESFKTGTYDIWLEYSHKNWAIGYTWPDYNSGWVKRGLFGTDTGGRYQGFYFNLRDERFQNIKLREALQYAFDFPWLNKNIFFNQYERTRSFFGPSELAATGLPSPAELNLLEPFRDQLPERVFTEEYNPPETDGTQESLRNNLRVAAQILLDAGYTMERGKLYPPGSDTPLSFEVVIYLSFFEPLVMSWAENLRLLGIEVKPRTLDLSQYQKRMEAYDFDAVATMFTHKRAPGSEQKTYWGSAYADAPGSYNYIGLKNPAVDAVLDAMVNAETRNDLLAATRAFDRIMCWNFYTVPHYNNAGMERVAYWDRFGHPKTPRNFRFPWTTTWWLDLEKDALILKQK